MTHPRIIATDLDGTLLQTGYTISDRTRRALRLARDAGAEIVLITARPPRYIDRIADAVGGHGTAICLNGALVYDLATRQVIHTQALGPDLARQVATAIRDAVPGIAFGIETGHTVISEATFTLRHTGDTHTSVATLDDVLTHHAEPGSIAKLLAWSATHGADDLLALALAAVPEGVELTHSGGTGLLEISAAGVTKAATLAALCQTRGLDASHVIAFGDMPNDLAVLQWAGTAYAMANAHPTVLVAIANRTAANTDDGVALVLERLYTTDIRIHQGARQTATVTRR